MAHELKIRFPKNKFRFPHHQAQDSGSAKPYGALSFQPSPVSHSSGSGNYIADTQARMPQLFGGFFQFMRILEDSCESEANGCLNDPL